MKALVVYESMFGNTREVASAIGAGLGNAYDVTVLPVAGATSEAVADADLLVLGGPTHAHGMSRAATRKAAGDQAGKPSSGTRLEPGAEGPGVREWLASLASVPLDVAAFDTRVRAPAFLTGAASHGISKALRRRGAQEVAGPESFFVGKDNRLEVGEEARARQWGQTLRRRSHDHARTPD